MTSYRWDEILISGGPVESVHSYDPPHSVMLFASSGFSLAVNISDDSKYILRIML